jgi:putative phosphoesterase
MTLLGVISDTHGLLRPEALDALRGSELIIHAGDVGKPEILKRLREIAPVVAVRGNVDTAPWAEALPETQVVRVAGRNIYVLHDRSQFVADPATASYAAVVFGHSHQALVETRDGVLYLNPGSAGPRRFRLPITVARLRVSTELLEPEIVQLA